MGSHAKYQPHILLDAETAVLLIHENDDIKEMRLKIVSASIKCTRCLILLLAPSVTSSSKLPVHWFLLANLSKFYEMKTCRQGETRFELKSRLILNYHQVAFIVKDIAEENPDSNIRAHLYPLEGDAQLMLRYPQFNAVSASLIAEHFSLKELLTLPIDTLCDRIPSLEERIKVRTLKISVAMGLNILENFFSAFSLLSRIGKRTAGSKRRRGERLIFWQTETCLASSNRKPGAMCVTSVANSK